MSHFNEGDDRSFKMEVALFLNNHYWYNTSSGTDKEANTHGYMLMKYIWQTLHSINKNTHINLQCLICGAVQSMLVTA